MNIKFGIFWFKILRFAPNMMMRKDAKEKNSQDLAAGVH